MKLTQNEVTTKEIIFEPGNCTRYHLLITQLPDELVVMVDMNREKKVTTFGTYHSTDTLALHLQIAGYSEGDAIPMAKYIISEIY